MRDIWVGCLEATSVSDQPIEVVERKGTGHPDTICDGVMEEVSLALCREYRERLGFIAHYNVDKGLLIVGEVEHRLGGGRILKPMRFVFGDRATFEVGGKRVPVEEIVVNSARRWLSRNLPRIDPERHVVYQVEVRARCAGAGGYLPVRPRSSWGKRHLGGGGGYAGPRPRTRTPGKLGGATASTALSP